MNEPNGIESPTLAKKIASGWTGQAEPPAQTVERAQQKITRTATGFGIGTFIAVAAVVMAWRALDFGPAGLALVALLFVVALFAGRLMDDDTLTTLAEIVFRRKKEQP